MAAIRSDVSPRVLPARVLNMVPLTTVRNTISRYDALLRRWLPSDLTPRAGGGLRRPRRGGADHTRRTAVRLLAGRVPPLRALARPRGGPVTHRRLGGAPGGARRGAALLGPGGAHRDEKRASASSRARKRRAHRHPLGDHGHRPHGGAAGAARPTSRRRGRCRPGRRPPVQRGAGRRSRGHRRAPGLSRQHRRRLERPSELRRPPRHAFTTSAIDDGLAPPGHHTVYLACPAAPSRVEGGWPGRVEELVERSVATVEARAPGFARSIRGIAPVHAVRHGAGRAVAWCPPHAPRHRPRPARVVPTDEALGGWRTPVDGLYISGAGTNPTGGIAGTPGRQATRTLLSDA